MFSSVFVYMSICSIYWCLLDDSCMFPITWHITYSLSSCIAGLHVSVIVHIFSFLLLFLALFGTLYKESGSYCFNILPRGSSVCRVGPWGIVQLWWVLFWCVSCFWWLCGLFLWFLLYKTCCYGYDCLYQPLHHGSTVHHLLTELLQ